jgi:chromosomal replication initiator protein
MYLARENTDLTFPDIARRFGGRNHTTVMHAVKRAADRLSSDREAYDTVRHLTERLSGADPDRQD